MKYFYIIAIILIIALSAIFRLGFPNSALFGGDEDSILCKILDFIDKHHLPPLLIRSHGVYTFSTIDFWLYFMMSFIRDPRMIVILTIGVPNTIAVILCFFYCYKFFNKRTTVLATALFGFSNWSIIFSKKLWGADILQFFSILIFFILTLGIYKSKLSMIALSILLLLFLPNLHLTGFSIFASVSLILIIYYSKMNLKYLFFAAVMLIAAIPILSICGRDLHKIFDLGEGIIGGYYNLGALSAISSLIVGDKWYFMYLSVSPKYPAIENFSEVFLKIIFIFGCVYIMKKIFFDLKLKRISAYLIVGIWFFVFVAIFGFTNLTTHAHYFMVVLPSLFIITSIGFFSVIDYISGKNKIQNWELLLLFLIFMLWSPWVAVLIIIVMFFIGKIPQKTAKYTLYSLIFFILSFQAFSNMQLFIDIEKKGKVPGRAGMDLGAKINAAKYVIGNAKSKFEQTGTKSYYSLLNDGGYSYIFRYLNPKNEDFISDNKTDCGFHYRIFGDIDEFNDQDMFINSLDYKKIGPKLIIVEKC